MRELKTKLYLRERRLLLVDHGYRGRELAAACRSMRDSGFHTVRVLPGGLEAWRRHIGPLAGEGLAEAALDRVGSAALESGLYHGDWVVIDVSESPASSSTTTPCCGPPAITIGLRRMWMVHGASPIRTRAFWVARHHNTSPCVSLAATQSGPEAAPRCLPRTRILS